MEVNTQCYIPVLEDISDEDDEEEDLTLIRFSSFPNGECSRTSPGNHSTVRRWRQRSARTDKDGDRSLRPQSSASLAPISVKTPAVLDLSGPSSAPGKIHWGAGGSHSSPGSRQAQPPEEKTRRPFDISSIVEDIKPSRVKVPKPIFEKSSRKTQSGQAIPVGIAVGRQREAPPTTASHSMATQPSHVAPSPSSPLLPSHNTGHLPPPLLPALTPLPLLPSHSPHPYYLPLQPSTQTQWTHSHQSGYGYPTNYPPDPSYYLYLQQHLLLLHHQHLQMSRQVHTSSNLAEDLQNHSQISSFEGVKQQTMVNNNEIINMNRSFDDKIKQQQEDNVVFQTNLPIQQKSVEIIETEKEEILENIMDKCNVEDMAERSIISDDLTIKLNIEPNNNESKNAILNQEFINIDIDDGTDTETSTVVENITDESFIDIEEDKTVADIQPNNDESDQSNHGLHLLAESIECMERSNETPKRKARYASTDCCDYQADSLQILSDVASIQPRQNIREKYASPRSERSQSLDSYKPRINRKHNNPNDIKEFILKTLLKNKKSELSDTKKLQPSINNVDDMDAWEIELRIQMADKQRKYNKINKKLLKIQKLKLKSPKMKLKNCHFKKEESNGREEKDEKKTAFSETFLKFKKAYLSANNVAGTNNKTVLSENPVKDNIDSTKSGEIKSIEENDKNVSIIRTPMVNKSNESCLSKDKKEVDSKKRIHEKFVVAKPDNVKMEIVEGNNFDADFYQYKHKKIRRISKDSEKVIKQEEIIKEIYKINDEKDIIDQDDSKHVNARESLVYGPSDKESQRIEKKRKKKRDKSKKKKKDKDKDKKKKKDKIKWEYDNQFVKTNLKPISDAVDHQRSCTLQAKDLVDGLRIIKRIGSHFYPGRLTEISAPDIYGIVVDKERGNKPHILTQEEVLNEAVVEMKPGSASELGVGARVCAFWSNQMNYLHPGTVAGPDTDQNFVIIQLDDGDSRDIHVDQVRYLPKDYPLVVASEDSITGLFGSRKRGSASQPQIDEKRVKTCSEDKKYKKHTKTKTKSKKKKQCEFEWSVSVKEVSESDNDETKSDTLDIGDIPSDEDQNSACVSNGDEDEPNVGDNESVPVLNRRISGCDKSAIAAFLPPQQLLWSWSDEGHKLSPKARKVYHDCIEKDDETMQVGDCAVFLSTGRPDRPYIGQIDSMWQTTGGGMKVRVKWFYHQAEVEGTAVGGGRVEDIKTEGALFSSSHYDENDVQTISHKCQVMQLQEFSMLVQSGGLDRDSEDTYYMAGEYDPVEGTIVFAEGVLGNILQ